MHQTLCPVCVHLITSSHTFVPMCCVLFCSGIQPRVVLTVCIPFLWGVPPELEALRCVLFGGSLSVPGDGKGVWGC